MRKFNYKPLLLLSALAVISVSLIAAIAYAWFTSPDDRKADTNAISIEQPPILYILDSNATDITQLSLGNLEIGKEKQIVFCISSVYPVTSENNSLFNGAFSLELAYTNNLGASYTIYPATFADESTEGRIEYYSQDGTKLYFTVDKQALAYQNVTELGNQKAYGDGYAALVQGKNQATYLKYQYDSTDTSSNSNLIFTNDNAAANPLANTSKCRYFVLNITWSGDISAVDAKETDLIYILAQGSAQKGGE